MADTERESVVSGSIGSVGPEVSWAQLSVPKLVCCTAVFNVLENVYFYPWHLIKTRQMVDRGRSGSSMATDTVRLVRGMVKQDGVKSLYKGFWTSSFAYLPSYVVYLVAYSWAKAQLGWDSNSTNTNTNTNTNTSKSTGKSNTSKLAAPSVAGFFADVVCMGLYVPADIIVQRIQLPQSRYGNFKTAVRLTWQEEGWRGFFRGLGATAITSGIGSAVWWQAYELTKHGIFKYGLFAPSLPQSSLITNGSGNGSSSSSQISGNSRSIRSPSSGGIARHSWEAYKTQLASGFVAGTCASVLTNPLDLIKTRLQTQGHAHASAATAAAHSAATAAMVAQQTALAAVPGSTAASAAAAAAATVASSQPHLQQQHYSSTTPTAPVSSPLSKTTAHLPPSATIPQLSVVQAAPSSASGSPQTFYRNTWHGLRVVLKEEGLRGFTRGLFPKIISRGPLSAASSIVYELTLTLSTNKTS
jgi:hypothetical protein